MSSRTGIDLAEHYKAIGREEKAYAIRTWLNAVKAELEKEGAEPDELDDAQRVGAIAIINVLLDRMNEASDAAPGSTAGV